MSVPCRQSGAIFTAGDSAFLTSILSDRISASLADYNPVPFGFQRSMHSAGWSVMETNSRHAFIGLAALALAAAIPAAASAQSQITTCVEISAAESPGLAGGSRRQAYTASDCDPSIASARAFEGARASASRALAATCRASVLGVQPARDICVARGLNPPTGSSTSVSLPPIPAGAPIDQAIGVGRSRTGIFVCTVIRNLPAETTTTTRPAGVQNGFCIFNSNRVTRVTARARARCGVQCL
jgi:hypothetical protein